MDWSSYKKLCDRPDVVTRWLLEETAGLLEGDPELAAALAAILDRAPLAKPEDHKGDARSDIFALTLSREQLDAILSALRAARAADRRLSDGKRGLGGFLEAWQEAKNALESGAAE